jgi:hypothetical protein
MLMNFHNSIVKHGGRTQTLQLHIFFLKLPQVFGVGQAHSSIFSPYLLELHAAPLLPRIVQQ